MASTPLIRGNRVTFTYAAPHAAMVNVLGTFNHWHLPEGVMEKGADGVWKRTVDVPIEGSYDYKFLVDGEWILDPANPDYGKDEKGRYNSRFQITTSASAVDHLRELAAGLESNPPGDPGMERPRLFLLADTMLQLPSAPHSRILKDHLDERLQLLAAQMADKSRSFVGFGYCHGNVVQRCGKTIAIDLVTGRSVFDLYWDIPTRTIEQIAAGIDALCVSHLHPDHLEPLLIKHLLARNVPVFVPQEAADRFPEGVIPIAPDATVECDEWLITFHKGLHVYDERRMLIHRYFEIVAPDDYRVVHTADHDYTTGVKKSGPVNLVIAKAGGVNPAVDSILAFENLLRHLQPERFLPGHMNELGHRVGGGREPYRTGLEILSRCRDWSGDILHWGETWPI